MTLAVETCRKKARGRLFPRCDGGATRDRLIRLLLDAAPPCSQKRRDRGLRPSETPLYIVEGRPIRCDTNHEGAGHGASGYIGGAVATALLDAGHRVVGLVRSDERAAQVRARGMEPLLGTLDDAGVLAQAAGAADAVINAANAEHRGAVEAILKGLAGSGKAFLQTSGSSIVADLAAGEPTDQVYDEDTPVHPLPGRRERVALNDTVLAAAADGVRAVVLCPSLIYGAGRGINANSIQIPWLIALARKHGVPRHIGRGENIWSNVHIDDLVDLYLLALDRAPAGAFYYVASGENSMREACQAIGRMLGLGERTEPMTLAQAAAEWGEGAAHYTMGSNSRVRAVRARRELGWAPHRPSLLEDIEHGSYREAG